ncbi:hypothetical protein C2U69_34715 [Cupriavidus pinatubonensis]|nr:hypothetical protein C2U69_34715 [Cupriavidus pinatubonensis]
MSSRTSLSAAVEKWLGIDASTARQIVCVRYPRQHKGCVQVKVVRPAGDLSLCFFRHADRSWRVFPT